MGRLDWTHEKRNDKSGRYAPRDNAWTHVSHSARRSGGRRAAARGDGMRRIVRTVGVIHLHHVTHVIIDDVHSRRIRIVHAGRHLVRILLKRIVINTVIRLRCNDMLVQPAHRASGQGGRRGGKHLRSHHSHQHRIDVRHRRIPGRLPDQVGIPDRCRRRA